MSENQEVPEPVKPKAIPFSLTGEFTRTVEVEGFSPFDITFRLPSQRTLTRATRGLTDADRALLVSVENKAAESAKTDGVSLGVNLTDDEALAYEEFALRVLQQCLTGWTLPEPYSPETLARMDSPPVIIRMYLVVRLAEASAKN